MAVFCRLCLRAFHCLGFTPETSVREASLLWPLNNTAQHTLWIILSFHRYWNPVLEISAGSDLSPATRKRIHASKLTRLEWQFKHTLKFSVIFSRNCSIFVLGKGINCCEEIHIYNKWSMMQQFSVRRMINWWRYITVECRILTHGLTTETLHDGLGPFCSGQYGHRIYIKRTIPFHFVTISAKYG